MKLLSYETSLNGEIYASPTAPLTELPLLVPLSPLLPPGISIVIVIRRFPPLSAASAESATKTIEPANAPSRSILMMRWTLMTNEDNSYYYFTTTYRCSIYFSSSSAQTSNFTATQIDFDIYNCTLKCVFLSQIIS